MRKELKDSLVTKAKKSGLEISEQEYVNDPEENLLKTITNWTEISAELSKGQGSELRERKGNNPSKFCSIFSSSALCVNNFALIKQNTSKITFRDYGCFDSVIFEGKVHTGISSPNLDVLMENEKYLCGVESKFTEYLSNKKINYKVNGKPTLTNYKDRINEISITKKNKLESILNYYIEKDKRNKKSHLDVAQLIKHSIGLINQAKKKGKTPVLIYIYWEPQNKGEIKTICDKHMQEIDEFSKTVNGFIEFKAISYPDYWNEFKKYAFLKTNIAENENRYLIPIL